MFGAKRVTDISLSPPKSPQPLRWNMNAARCSAVMKAGAGVTIGVPAAGLIIRCQAVCSGHPGIKYCGKGEYCGEEESQGRVGGCSGCAGGRDDEGWNNWREYRGISVRISENGDPFLEAWLRNAMWVKREKGRRAVLSLAPLVMKLLTV